MIFKLGKFISTILLLSPLEKGYAPLSLLDPRIQYFVPSLVEIGQVVLEKKLKLWKVYDHANVNNNDGQQTNFDQKNLTWAFGSCELKCIPKSLNDDELEQLVKFCIKQ